MSKYNQLSGAIRFALFAGAASLMASPAFAQESKPEEKAQTLDTIVVTGTRIQSQSITASSPVTEIQKEEFQFAGATRVEDLVNQYPQLSPQFDSFNNNPSLGYPTVDLRGLGPDRTLTLVNGFRLPQGAGEFRDISIIPASLIKKVDILTGGASAVYGSDAVAGVVNFILDTDFEGLSISAGYNAYQHKNRNEYIQGLLRARNFPFPDGDSGFDGVSKNIDIAMGSSFADGAGHAMAWMTWRQNDPLFQGQRDYSSCALNVAGTACGGSATNATGNFYFYQPGSGLGSSASLNPNGTWRDSYGAPYNYAPPNYYQRPDERYTFGASLKYEVNEYFRPYMEMMYANKKDSLQIAESGAFFTLLSGIDCSAPFLRTACADLGFDPADGPLDIYVAKRNVEGGPRRTDTENSSYRLVFGGEGQINDNWSYNASFLYARTQNDNQGFNDFLTDRIQQALLGCPPGSFSGCLFYNVWQPGGVTREAAQALAGVSLAKTATELKALNAYVTGELPIGFEAGNISMVAGADWREDSYSFVADSNSAAGNFAGSGAASPPLDATIKVTELFMEAAIPLVKDLGILESMGMDIGYRSSDYSLSGKADTYKIGMAADFGPVRARGGFNHAIRAPGTSELFNPQGLALFSGSDPCAGATPLYTQAQCANTGVSAARYGTVPNNPAQQFNQLIGGNPNLKPEGADTWTVGFAATPISGLELTLDYFNIKIEDTITSIGAQTILEQCGLTGNAQLCALVRRNPASGDLWRGQSTATSGYVINLTNNFGERLIKGFDVGANYSFNALGGRFNTSFQGAWIREDKNVPLPGVSDAATFDCAGVINVFCQSPEWRHIANVRYSRDWYTVNLRWRYYGELDYVSATGTPLTADRLLCKTGTTVSGAPCMGSGGIKAYNYIDLSTSMYLGEFTTVTFGVNNVADKEPPMVGSSLALNGNAPGSYDQAGRFIFANVSFKF